MAVCGRQILPLDVAICCSIGCLHLIEDSLFSHCQCSASSKDFKGSRSNDIGQKAQKANNMWWRVSGFLGDQNCMLMYIMFQAAFTVCANIYVLRIACDFPNILSQVILVKNQLGKYPPLTYTSALFYGYLALFYTSLVFSFINLMELFRVKY
ncbi:hypothetical protein MKX03_003244 [Papaver bracteatum]|nr:hypothetical protein MKX03_003244 [Papaver bracteatum]